MCTLIECFYNNYIVTSLVLFLQKNYWSMFLQFLIKLMWKGVRCGVHICGFGCYQLFHRHSFINMTKETSHGVENRTFIRGNLFAMTALERYSLTLNIYFDGQRNTSCLGLHSSCQWMFSSPC